MRLCGCIHTYTHDHAMPPINATSFIWIQSPLDLFLRHLIEHCICTMVYGTTEGAYYTFILSIYKLSFIIHHTHVHTQNNDKAYTHEPIEYRFVYVYIINYKLYWCIYAPKGDSCLLVILILYKNHDLINHTIYAHNYTTHECQRDCENYSNWKAICVHVFWNFVNVCLLMSHIIQSAVSVHHASGDVQRGIPSE